MKTFLWICLVGIAVATPLEPRSIPSQTNEDEERFEVSIPDESNESKPKLMTLQEIQALLARRVAVPLSSESDSLHLLAFGSSSSIAPPPANVASVVSSVKTIMASEMAQLLNLPKPSMVITITEGTTTIAPPETTFAPSTDHPNNVEEGPVQLFVRSQPEMAPKSDDPFVTTVESVEVTTEAVFTTPLGEESEFEHLLEGAEPEPKPVQYAAWPAEGYHGHHDHHDHHDHHHHHHHEEELISLGPAPTYNRGLLVTSDRQVAELRALTSAANHLSWQVWSKLSSTAGDDSIVMSPISLISALGMAFLGARSTSLDALDAALGLDALATVNPHLHLRQVAQEVPQVASFAHGLFLQTDEGSPVLDVYRARLQTLYGATVAEVDSPTTLRRAAMQLISSLLKTQSIPATVSDRDIPKLRPPLGLLSSSFLQVNFPGGQGGEMDYLALPGSAQVSSRRVVSVSAVSRQGTFMAGYDPYLDATAVAIPTGDEVWNKSTLSLILVLPGSLGKFDAGGPGLHALEERLASRNGTWDSLLKSLQPRALNVRFPQLSVKNQLQLGRSIMAVRAQPGTDSPGLATLFDPDKADFSGLAKTGTPLHLVDVAQVNQIKIGLKEDWANTQTGGVEGAESLVINRAFLYAVRHNPSGLLLFNGRYVKP